MEHRYARVREIGRGGMGAVFLGEDTVLGRPVAMKRVGPGVADGETGPERVLREARTLASLQHPHVVAVYDLVEEEGADWLVMEYVESRNLAEVVRTDGPLDPDTLAPLLAQVADGLQAAHRAGIVHRDVKPSNILVTADGTAKIADFGIARGRGDAPITGTGLMTGSPAYIAPEVARGQQAGPGCDVWSLGATAYYALTGTHPYSGTATGSDAMSTLVRVVDDEAPRTDRAGWLGPALAGMLEKDPHIRWSPGAVGSYVTAAGLGSRGAATPTVASTAGRAGQETQLMTAVAAPERPEAPRAAVEAPPQRPEPPSPTPDRDDASRKRRALPWLVGAGVALLVVLLWVIARALMPADEPAPAATSGSASATAEPSETASESPSDDASPETSPDPVTAEQLDAFVRDYVAQVTADPRKAWTKLTPGFQSASGGYGTYQGFWGTIESAEVTDVRPRPEEMAVSYRVHYTRTDGEEFDSSPTLILVREGDTLRIAGESDG